MDEKNKVTTIEFRNLGWQMVEVPKELSDLIVDWLKKNRPKTTEAFAL